MYDMKLFLLLFFFNGFPLITIAPNVCIIYCPDFSLIFVTGLYMSDGLIRQANKNLLL